MAQENKKKKGVVLCLDDVIGLKCPFFQSIQLCSILVFSTGKRSKGKGDRRGLCFEQSMLRRAEGRGLFTSTPSNHQERSTPGLPLDNALQNSFFYCPVSPPSLYMLDDVAALSKGLSH